MKRTMTFGFGIGDSVYLKEIERVGFIDSLSIDLCGVTYRVVFWDNGCRQSVWLYECELEDVK